MEKENGCLCRESPKLLFACSGASRLGEIADRVSRRLSADGVAKMFCLAGIGGRVSGMIASAKASPQLIAIDGCPQDCARKTLEQAGFAEITHFRINDLASSKGKSNNDDESIAILGDEIKNSL